MQLSVEISKYPLSDDFKPAIKDFIARIKQHSTLTVVCNTMSTQIFGEFDLLMPILATEMKQSFEQFGKQVFICKFINVDLAPKD